MLCSQACLNEARTLRKQNGGKRERNVKHFHDWNRRKRFAKAQNKLWGGLRRLWIWIQWFYATIIFEGDQEPPQNSSYCKLISESSLLYPLALNVPRVSIVASWSTTFFVKGRYAVLLGRESGKCVPLFIIYLSRFDDKSLACYFSIHFTRKETAVSYMHRAL